MQQAYTRFAMAERDEHLEGAPVPGSAAVTSVEKDEDRHVEDAASESPEDVRVAQLLMHTIDVPILAEAVDRQEAADAADTLETLEERDVLEVLEQMEDERAAGALAEMETPLAVGVLDDLVEDDPGYAARLVELMAPDDAADLLQAAEPEVQSVILDALPDDHAAKLVQLARYEEESAGGIMTTDYLAIREDMSIGEATEYIRSLDVSEEMNDALVVDQRHRLVGMIGLRLLLLARNRERVGDLMTTTVKALRPEMDREEVAREFDRYDYSMMPVVDPSDRLLGIVTFDDVIDIIRQEQTEDVQKSVGAGKGEAVYSSIMQKFRGRFPWLGASLGLMCASASVILFFHRLVEQQPILAFLMPVIAAVTGNAGQQSLMVTLRGIVLEEVRRDRIWPLILREAFVGMMTGIVLGAFLFGIVAVLSTAVDTASPQVGMVAGIAIAISMTVGTLTGCGMPLLMRRLGIDPALAASIFLIMVTDAIAFTSILTLTLKLIPVE